MAVSADPISLRLNTPLTGGVLSSSGGSDAVVTFSSSSSSVGAHIHKGRRSGVDVGELRPVVGLCARAHLRLEVRLCRERGLGCRADARLALRLDRLLHARSLGAVQRVDLIRAHLLELVALLAVLEDDVAERPVCEKSADSSYVFSSFFWSFRRRFCVSLMAGRSS